MRPWATFGGRVAVVAGIAVAGGVVWQLLHYGNVFLWNFVALLPFNAIILLALEVKARWLTYAKLERDQLFLRGDGNNTWVKYADIHGVEVDGEAVVLDCDARSWLYRQRQFLAFQPFDLEGFMAALSARLAVVGGANVTAAPGPPLAT